LLSLFFKCKNLEQDIASDRKRDDVEKPKRKMSVPSNLYYPVGENPT
jgi:hypothetical protein